MANICGWMIYPVDDITEFYCTVVRRATGDVGRGWRRQCAGRRCGHLRGRRVPLGAPGPPPPQTRPAVPPSVPAGSRTPSLSRPTPALKNPDAVNDPSLMVDLASVKLQQVYPFCFKTTHRSDTRSFLIQSFIHFNVWSSVVDWLCVEVGQVRFKNNAFHLYK